MADLSDVENALRDAVAEAVYPGGVPAGPLPASPTVGAPVRVIRGWVTPEGLNADVKAGIVNVCIFADGEVARDTTRFVDKWVRRPTLALLTAEVDRHTVTLGGACRARDVVGLVVNGEAYRHEVAPGDTLASVAAALAAMVPGASASGPVVTLPAEGPDAIARVAAPGLAMREIARILQEVVVAIWTPTPDLRDATARVLMPALTDIRKLPLADGSAGWMRYRRGVSLDAPSKGAAWRRHLCFAVEYPITQTREFPAVLFPGATVELRQVGQPD